MTRRTGEMKMELLGKLSAAKEDRLAVAEALSEAVLRNSLRSVQSARILNDDTVLRVTTVDEAVEDALLAVARADRSRLHAGEDNDGRADLSLEAVLREVQSVELLGDLPSPAVRIGSNQIL